MLPGCLTTYEERSDGCLKTDDCDRTCPGCSASQTVACGRNACGACCGGACKTDNALSALEIELLEQFAVTPFLPLVKEADSGRLHLLETDLNEDAARIALSLLQRRGLVSVDAELPLENTDYSAYIGFSHGSAALTAHGQEILDELEFGGS